MKAINFYNREFYNAQNSNEQNMESAKKNGYTHYFAWINSDLGWLFFTKSFDDAEEEAINLYMKEMKETDREFAAKFYSEKIDVCEL